MINETTRRAFLRSSAQIASGTIGLGLLSGGMMANAAAAFASPNATPLPEFDNIIGPKAGYSPQVGTLVSMLNWMREVILMPVKGLTIEQLDYLHDDKSNSIGAMLLHLAATERFYQLHTLDNRKWGDWPEADAKRFSTASELGDAGRKAMKATLELLRQTHSPKCGPEPSPSSKSATITGSSPSTKNGRGDRPIIIASGSTYASTNPTTTARSVPEKPPPRRQRRQRLTTRSPKRQQSKLFCILFCFRTLRYYAVQVTYL